MGNKQIALTEASVSSGYAAWPLSAEPDADKKNTDEAVLKSSITPDADKKDVDDDILVDEPLDLLPVMLVSFTTATIGQEVDLREAIQLCLSMGLLELLTGKDRHLGTTFIWRPRQARGKFTPSGSQLTEQQVFKQLQAFVDSRPPTRLSPGSHDYGRDNRIRVYVV